MQVVCRYGYRAIRQLGVLRRCGVFKTAVARHGAVWQGEGVVVFLHAAVRLCVKLGLEGGQLLGHAQETPDLHAQDHPDNIYTTGEARGGRQDHANKVPHIFIT